jgi:hypothetical protein
LSISSRLFQIFDLHTRRIDLFNLYFSEEAHEHCDLGQKHDIQGLSGGAKPHAMDHDYDDSDCNFPAALQDYGHGEEQRLAWSRGCLCDSSKRKFERIKPYRLLTTRRSA